MHYNIRLFGQEELSKKESRYVGLIINFNLFAITHSEFTKPN